jgi:hypothetical protein
MSFTVDEVFSTPHKFRIKTQEEFDKLGFNWRNECRAGFVEDMDELMGKCLTDTDFFNGAGRHSEDTIRVHTTTGRSWTMSMDMLTIRETPSEMHNSKIILTKPTRKKLLMLAEQGVGFKLTIDCTGYEAQAHRDTLRVFNRDISIHINAETNNARIVTHNYKTDDKSVNKLLKVLFTEDVTMNKGEISAPKFKDDSGNFNFNYNTGKHEADCTFF